MHSAGPTLYVVQDLEFMFSAGPIIYVVRDL